MTVARAKDINEIGPGTRIYKKHEGWRYYHGYYTGPDYKPGVPHSTLHYQWQVRYDRRSFVIAAFKTREDARRFARQNKLDGARVFREWRWIVRR